MTQVHILKTKVRPSRLARGLILAAFAVVAGGPVGCGDDADGVAGGGAGGEDGGAGEGGAAGSANNGGMAGGGVAGGGVAGGGMAGGGMAGGMVDGPLDASAPDAALDAAASPDQGDGNQVLDGAAKADAEVSVPMCIALGGTCTGFPEGCCPDSTCIVGEPSTDVCAANCEGDSDCPSKCCVALKDSLQKVCGPQTLCAEPPPTLIPRKPSGCGRLILVGQGGKFLGLLTGNKFAMEGVCNQSSKYGNKISPTSIFNPFGEYGSDFGAKSAYNKLSASPPLATCETLNTRQFLVTRNEVIPGPKIDPDLLCAALLKAGI